MLIIPAIDLRSGHCVRLVQGRKDAATVYDGDPVEIAKDFERDGAQLLHVVDLDGAFSETNSPNRDVLKRIIEAVNIPVQFGGGLRDMESITRAFELGVTRTVIGTLAVESPEIMRRLVSLFGGDGIVVGIDAKDDQVMTRGWEWAGNTGVVELARRVAHAGVERIIYTDVTRDGMLNGPNIETTNLIARESGLKVTASGGVSSLRDLGTVVSLKEIGVDSVIVGKALYERRFTLSEAMRVVNSDSI
ncbi:MAG: 1-(5-phosphoribosyl)-5-[(5-phosphoribosylamino)methylideneamino]imidazole-4-carboxamide isomerase [Pyrinomonadaceae bacterium]